MSLKTLSAARTQASDVARARPIERGNSPMQRDFKRGIDNGPVFCKSNGDE
jgi:hypothetical protein